MWNDLSINLPTTIHTRQGTDVMWRMLLLPLLLASLTSAYVNNWDETFQFECPRGEFIDNVLSTHSNHHEDRRWGYRCRKLRGDYAGSYFMNCVWSGFVNDFQEMVAFRCPGKGAITGVHSVHDNGKEDRRFSFKCCQVANFPMKECQYTAYLNDWDGNMDYTVPDRFILVGFASYYGKQSKLWKLPLLTGDKHDRRWKAEICRFKKCPR